MAALNLHEIARMVGVQTSALYKYFPSKAAIYDELYRRGMALVHERLETAYREHEPGWERLRAWAEVRATFAQENPDLEHILFGRDVPGFTPSEESMAFSRARLEASRRAMQGSTVSLRWETMDRLGILLETVLEGLPLTEDPQPPTPDLSDESHLDRGLDQFVEKHPGLTDAIDNLVIPGFDQKLDTVLSDLDRESVADKAMLAEFAKLPDAEAPGISVTALSDADKTFDDHQVVSVARECCLILQNARVYEQPDLGAAELSPDLEAELREAIGRDAASHRHHLLPGLEIDDARIVKALLVDGKEVVTVRLWMRGEQLVRDDATAEIVEGSEDDIKWQEDWTLTRDPRVSDYKGEDEALTLSGQWFLAHKGWVVTKIERVDDASPGPSSLLS